jgi:hypothetical protein
MQRARSAVASLLERARGGLPRLEHGGGGLLSTLFPHRGGAACGSYKERDYEAESGRRGIRCCGIEGIR